MLKLTIKKKTKANMIYLLNTCLVSLHTNKEQ